MASKKAKDQAHPSGISNAALEGARSTNQPATPPRDAKTISPAQQASKPSKLKEPTQRPRAIELPNDIQDDDDQQWRRAGGKSKGESRG